jgi:metallo-beta-lactamase family protein
MGTAPTLEITGIILKDSAKIHEEEAKRANKEGFTQHRPALPFYDLAEAQRAIALLQPQEEDVWIPLSEHVQVRFQYAGHILGATYIEMDVHGKRFVFSGDVGRPKDALLQPPKKPKWADYLFMESTYGHKLHPNEDVGTLLTHLIKETITKRGTLIIPSFAVERLQTLMYVLWMLYKKNKIPNIPMFIDSPMGANVLSVFERHPQWHTLSENDYRAMCSHFTTIGSYKDTWKTIDDPRPKVVIAGSGMVTGGRVLTYLKQLLDQERTTVLLVGFQAEGTRGRQLLEGGHELKLFGRYIPVKAKVAHLDSLSAHADQGELLDWLSDITNVPEKVFLVHGEPVALDALRLKLKDTFGWQAHIPHLAEVHELFITP